MSKDSAFPSRWWVSQGIAAGCPHVLCCHKDFTHRLDNLFNKSTCIYLFFFFFSGIYLETHSRIIILAPCLLTWHTLLIISNLMLSLGGKSSICNIAQMVSCDETFHAGEKNKLKNHRRILTQKYTHILVIVYRSDWLPGMFLSPLKKHLLISVGNFCACY